MKNTQEKRVLIGKGYFNIILPYTCISQEFSKTASLEAHPSTPKYTKDIIVHHLQATDLGSERLDLVSHIFQTQVYDMTILLTLHLYHNLSLYIGKCAFLKMKAPKSWSCFQR